MDRICCPLPKDSSVRLASSCVLALTGGTALFYYWRGRKEAANKQQLAKAIENRKKRVRKQKDAMKRTTQSIDENLRKRIVNLSSEDLLNEIAENRLTVLQVLQAYKAESFQVDLRVNCITEYLEDAEELAKDLDKKKEKGPLHGLPVSVKETFPIKDLDCTVGMAYLLDKPCSQDAPLVASLKKLGAVIFTRTNIVQTTFSYGNSNPIYGATWNPHNPKRITGGSTAGEAALIGGRGSLVGLGTDLGGSVRIPAAMSGHFSLKPTQKRLSGEGIKTCVASPVGLHDCPGIMSREIQAIITVFRALVTSVMFDLDPQVIPLTFQNELFTSTQPLTIGYYEEDGIVVPTPGCKRAVRIAKRILEKMGHKVVPFAIPNVSKAHELAMNFPAVDGGQGLDNVLSHEPEVEECMIHARKSFFHRLKETITGKKFMTILGSTIVEKSAYELCQLMAERENYLQLFIGTMKRQKIDALLAPGYAMPACPPDFIVPTEGSVFVTMLYNMLNFPVGAVPVTRETKGDQLELDKNYPTDNPLQRNIKEATKGATGLPLGIQIVGLPWKEEMVLRVMKDLDEGIKKRFVPDEPTPPIMDGVA